jgi:microcystin-dependent protein
LRPSLPWCEIFPQKKSWTGFCATGYNELSKPLLPLDAHQQKSLGSNPFAKTSTDLIHMAEPFLSEIRIMSFVFAPKGWALCNGQLLPINQNQALFSLLGTTFGGDGRVNFALPDLRGNVPIHVGSGHTLGEKGGEQAHTLSVAELPTHTHVLNGTNTDGSQAIPIGNLLARSATQLYAPATNLQAMNAGSVGNTGGSQAHLNMQPFLILSFCIALQGIFPSPT